ncbi:MAG: hypothetical protein D6816_15835 [Bacteroidetes bacterium]|nr:MAG: hypothetical protein D6816_15835 [Bacteroidota bacterium]
MSKAGSSAIQQALVDNDEMLRASGIIYPRAGRRGGAHYKIDEDLRRRGSTSRLRRALDEAADFRTAVLSCEGF